MAWSIAQRFHNSTINLAARIQRPPSDYQGQQDPPKKRHDLWAGFFSCPSLEWKIFTLLDQLSRMSSHSNSTAEVDEEPEVHPGVSTDASDAQASSAYLSNPVNFAFLTDYDYRLPRFNEMPTLRPVRGRSSDAIRWTLQVNHRWHLGARSCKKWKEGTNSTVPYKSG